MEDYPKTVNEFENKFSTDEACREYLAKMRWPDGFICPRCGENHSWTMKNGRILCSHCRHQQYLLQGTVFEKSHLELITWFRAMWYICSEKNGASALGLQRTLGFGSYETAWLILHKLRRAMIRPDRDKLTGEIEFDETYIGGIKTGKRGRGAQGKTIVVVAAEKDGKGIGRIRMECVPSFSAQDLRTALFTMVAPGSIVITDGLQSYRSLPDYGYMHTIERDEEDLEECRLSRCHLVISLLKRWILGTLQGSVSHEHLQDYLNEFTFRFNRRKSASRGKLFFRLMQYAVATNPATYKEIKKHNL